MKDGGLLGKRDEEMMDGGIEISGKMMGWKELEG